MATPYSRYLIGSLPWYSVLVVTGMALAVLIAGREEKRRGLPPDTVLDLALCVIPCGIIGARLYYAAFAWEMFADDPLRVLRVWEGGLAVYGGVIGGGLAALVFSRVRRIHPGVLTDMIVPGLALAQAIGRWGNYFNMEAYGREITSAAWQFFPAGVLVPRGGRMVWHMATFFYESIWDLGVFAALMALRRRVRAPLALTCWYFVLYGAGRLVIEGLRTDSLTLPGGLRVSQALSLLMILVAGGWLCRHHGRKT